MIYSIFDDTGNLVEAYDNRVVALNAFARYTSMDEVAMALFAHNDSGELVESFVYEAQPPVSLVEDKMAGYRERLGVEASRIIEGEADPYLQRKLSAPPARPRGRTLAQARADNEAHKKRMAEEARKVIEDDLDAHYERMTWEDDHFCETCNLPIDACSCGRYLGPEYEY